MVSKEEVVRLAALARLDVEEGDIDHVAKEMSDIVAYVSQVEKISGDVEFNHTHVNVMREDNTPHDGGLYTEDLLANAPTTKNNLISVPKIISND